jgi:tripartite ATP-independent transporter DctM subunit
MLVLMADRIGDPAASTGRLFMGALLPGILLGFMYIAYILAVAYIKKDFAPAPKNRAPFTPRLILDVILAILPPMLLIVAVLGSIFTGFATTTEASAVGAFGALLLALFNRQLDMETLKQSLYQTSLTTAFIFAIFIGATVFAAVLRGLGGDDVVREALLGLPFGETGILLSILLVVFLLGFFLDWVEITLIILPLVIPVVFALGVDPVWFAILFAICLQTSFLTPPVGFALFYIKGVCPPGISTWDIYQGIAPYVLLQLLALMLVFWFQPLATWLPHEVYSTR